VTPTLRIARVADTPENMRAIIGLREEASAWLSLQGTDQWQKPWPIVTRYFAGRGLGAQLIDWTGLRGYQDYGAEWIRIDVWSSSLALHEYYAKRGFKSCGECPDRRYPSGILFQKNVLDIVELESPLFAEFELPAGPFTRSSAASGGSCPPGVLDEESQTSTWSRRRATSLSRS
jgi:hypothetical protein